MPIEDVAKLPQWAGDRFFFAQMQQNAPFFTMKLRYEGDELIEAVLNGRENLLERKR